MTVHCVLCILVRFPSLQIDDFDIVNVEGEHIIDLEVGGNQGAEQANELISQALLGIQRTTIAAENDESNTRLSLVSVQTIRNDFGAVVGGLVISRDINSEFLNLVNFDRQGVELSLIYDNQVIAASDTDSADGNELDTNETLQPELIAAALSGEIAVNPEIVYLDQENPYAEVYLPVQGLDDRFPTAVVVARVNNEAISAFQSNLTISSSILLALLSLVTIMVILVIVRLTVTRPIGVLQQAASAIARGNYSNQVILHNRDEIGKLAQAFNQMSDDIQQRQAELTELNQSLEQRVIERTAELKVARDEALAAQRIAKENDRLKSEFLSTMSHELRTPLNAIEGFTSIMLGGMGIELSERAEDMVKRISSNSKRLLHLINDFLDLSRIESGRMELVKEPISPENIASKWQNSVGILAEEKGVDFVIQVSPNLPPTLLGDEDALSKIGINLLSNAFKFTHEGQVSLDLQRSNGNWLISVSDTGIGIPSHAREYIFDEFRQVDGSSKRLYGGTGLGLALVQKLARAMNGSVTLDSEVGKGSTFVVSLPLEVPEEEKHKEFENEQYTG